MLRREQPTVLVHDGEFTDVVTEADPAQIARVVAAPGGAAAQLPTLAELRGGDPSPLDATGRGGAHGDPHLGHDGRARRARRCGGRRASSRWRGS